LKKAPKVEEKPIFENVFGIKKKQIWFQQKFWAKKEEERKREREGEREREREKNINGSKT
jgi:hypothetical protein